MLYKHIIYTYNIAQKLNFCFHEIDMNIEGHSKYIFSHYFGLTSISVTKYCITEVIGQGR